MSTKIKNRPVKIKDKSGTYGTFKSSRAGKMETLRRKTIRREKYNGSAK